MPNQLEIAMTLKREMPPFQSGLARGLRLDSADQQELAAVPWPLWTPWIVAAFSDGECVQAVDREHPILGPLSKRGLELLGAEVVLGGKPRLSLVRGELSKRVQTLSEKKDLGSQGRFDTLATACSRFLITSCSLMGADSRQWLTQVPSVPQTRIEADRKTGKQLSIRFTGNEFTYPLHSNPESVVTFGPGMSGSHFVADMVGRTQNVHLVSGGSSAAFIHKWNQGQLQRIAANLEGLRHGGKLPDWAPALPPGPLRLPETFHYDDGIAASIGMIASRTVERGKPVDIVVMSSVHSAGRPEVEAGVDGAHLLLGEGGLLVVKAPRTSVGYEGGMDVVARRAIPLFGSPVAAGEAGELSQYVDSSLPEARPADFAIFQKQ